MRPKRKSSYCLTKDINFRSPVVDKLKAKGVSNRPSTKTTPNRYVPMQCRAADEKTRDHTFIRGLFRVLPRMRRRAATTLRCRKEWDPQPGASSMAHPGKPCAG